MIAEERFGALQRRAPARLDVDLHASIKKIHQDGQTFFLVHFDNGANEAVKRTACKANLLANLVGAVRPNDRAIDFAGLRLAMTVSLRMLG